MSRLFLEGLTLISGDQYIRGRAPPMRGTLRYCPVEGLRRLRCGRVRPVSLSVILARLRCGTPRRSKFWIRARLRCGPVANNLTALHLQARQERSVCLRSIGEARQMRETQMREMRQERSVFRQPMWNEPRFIPPMAGNHVLSPRNRMVTRVPRASRVCHRTVRAGPSST